MMSQALVALDMGSEQALRKINWRERRQVRAAVRRNRRDILKDAFNSFAEQDETVERVEWGDDPDDDTPILDFWRWLIDNERIQAFMTFLVDKFLPALFEIIVTFIGALAIL